MPSKGKNQGGLQSSAGLVRYFESEGKSAILIDPRTIVAFGMVFGFFVLGLSALM